MSSLGSLVRLFGVLSLVLCASWAQDLIKVPLKVGDDLEYEVNLFPTPEGVASITRQFCMERKADFGITEANLDICTEPVQAYLMKFVPAQPEPVPEPEPEMSIPLKVGESEFDISFIPTADAAVATAMTFCQQHGASFGVTEETFMDACLNPIGKYLKDAAEKEAGTRQEQRKLNAEADERARQLALEPDDITVPMKIGELAFNISWNSKRSNAKNMAIKFCSEHSEDIKASFEDCLGPVESHLTVQSEAQIEAQPPIPEENEIRIVKAKLAIAGVDYDFRFEPSESDALRVATNFCAESGPALGVAEETMDTQCIKPVLSVLLDALSQV